MMEIKDPRIRSLMRRAIRVEESGKRAAASDLYQQIVQEAPETTDAWIGLGRVASSKGDADAAFSRALELEPENLEAKVGQLEARGEPVPEAWREELEAEPEPEPEPEPVPKTAVDEPEFELFCYRHPKRSTSLRCYNCEKPICISCANKTSVGYLCPECLNELEDKFYNASALDYLIALAVSLPLSLVAGTLVWRLSGSFFIILILIFAGGAVGSLIGRLTKRAIGGRRGRYLPQLVVAMMVVGVLVPGMAFLVGILTGVVGIFALVAPGIYLFVAGGSAYYWMK